MTDTNGNEITQTVIENLPVVDTGEFDNLLDTSKFEHLYRVAKMFSCSTMVPVQYQSQPENCMIALQMAFRLKVDPMMLMQNTYVLNGKPGMEAKLVIALVNARGPFKGAIQYEYRGEGDTRSCTAWGVHKETGERCEQRVSIQTAKDEGWYARNKKWQSIPDLMLAYRSAAWLARLYAPETIMGLQTADEVIDVSPAPGNTGDVINPDGSVAEKAPTLDRLRRMTLGVTDQPEVSEGPETPEVAEIKPPAAKRKAKTRRKKIVTAPEPEVEPEPEPEPVSEDDLVAKLEEARRAKAGVEEQTEEQFLEALHGGG